MPLPPTAALAAALLATASPPQSTPFVDVTEDAGISFQQRRATRDCQLYFGAACEMEFMSGGIAVGDVNGDGWPDLYLTSIDGPDRLYENRRDGTFVDTTLARGLLRTEPTNAAQFVDVDQDGDQDLVVTVFAPSSATTARHHQLWIQGDDGTFDEQALARGFVPPGIEGMNGWGIAAGDIDRDGWPDLVLTQWLEDAPDASRVLMNRGAIAPGHFLHSGHAWEVDLEDVWGFAATLVDLDHDGWQDLAVAGDFGTSRLYWNEGPAGFVEGTAAAGVGTDENGMGSAFGDVDGDGDLDWFVTSIWDPADTCGTGTCNWGITGNRLYVNEGGRGFRDGTDAFGVRDGAWGWGAAFLDFDNDARLDLVMTNGVQFPTPFAAPFFADRNRFWVQGGAGPMHEAAERAGLGDTGSGKGLVTLDYDRDGDLDVLVTNNSGTPTLFRNDRAPDHAWLQVDVRGTISNCDALGATVEVVAGGRTQRAEVGVGAHFLGNPEHVLHFGLGASASADRVTVRFPASGIEHVRTDVAGRRRIVVVE